MNELAKKLVEQKRAKALEMAGKKIEIQLTHKALTIDEDTHTAIFVMSTCSIDRHGDIVDQDSWKLEYFKLNPYFALQHRSDQFPLGKWLEVWLEADPNNPGKQRLVGKAEFAVDIEGADDIKRAWEHVKRGDMNMVSIGFIPHRVEYDENTDAFVLYDCELMECSLVGIGSNRQALVKEVLTTEKKDVVEVDEKKEALIKVASALDIELQKENTKSINRAKAHELVCKAIRQMK
jgi:HK97 family phage prohead protease